MTGRLSLIKRRHSYAETSEYKAAKGRKEQVATMGDVLKWFGVLIMITQIDFRNRCDLWSDCSAKVYTSQYQILELLAWQETNLKTS
jgi:hypothetical protein